MFILELWLCSELEVASKKAAGGSWRNVVGHVKRSGKLKQQGSVEPKMNPHRSVTKVGGMTRKRGVGQKQL